MVSLSNHVAISLRLSKRRGTTIATVTRLPRYGDEIAAPVSSTGSQ